MQNFGPIHFYRDFSYKIEFDFNVLVNFFLVLFGFKGNLYVKISGLIFFCPKQFLKRFFYKIEDNFHFWLVRSFFNFFLWCPLPSSLPSGSSARTLRRGRQAEFDEMGWGGMVGCGVGAQKCPLLFSFQDILNTISI